MACKVRIMEPAEVEIATYLAYKEGWNPGVADGWAFYHADSNGFFLAEIDDKVVGCISAVKYSDDYGFIGFYVVEPEHRKTAAGTMLAVAALKYLNGCNIGIDGVPARLNNYEKLGFSVHHNNARYETIGADYKYGINVTCLKSVSRNFIYDYDRKCFPADRRSFLDAWLELPNSYSYIYWDENKVKGYGVIRKCRKGYKIGPLFADNSQVADSLYRALVSNAIDELVYLDIPMINTEALNLVEFYDMKNVFETSRMYSVNTPNIELDKIFGITSFELG